MNSQQDPNTTFSMKPCTSLPGLLFFYCDFCSASIIPSIIIRMCYYINDSHLSGQNFPRGPKISRKIPNKKVGQKWTKIVNLYRSSCNQDDLAELVSKENGSSLEILINFKIIWLANHHILTKCLRTLTLRYEWRAWCENARHRFGVAFILLVLF